MTKARHDTRSPQLRLAHRFEFAAADMDEVAAAAAWLTGGLAAPAPVVRLLETGIVVTYARPFTKQGVGTIDRVKYAPASIGARRLHDWLIRLRDILYAHTDQSSLRFMAENVHDLFGLSIDTVGIAPGSAIEFVVESLAASELPAVADLAREQAERFRAAAAAARAAAPDASPASGRRMRAGGISPVPRIGAGTDSSDDA